MRSDNMGSFTPRGRRLGRAMVAVAALAVLLGATSAQAAIMNFQIVPELSSLSIEEYVGDPGLGGFSGMPGDDGIPYPHFSTGDTYLHLGAVTPAGDYGQPNPSNVAPAFGNFQVDVNTGTSLKIQPGAFVSYQALYPYWPYRADGGGESTISLPIDSDPRSVGGLGPGTNAQIGFSVVTGTATGPDVKPVNGADIGYANIYGLTQTFGSISTQSPDGGAAMPYIGGNSYFVGDLALFGLSGTEDIYTALTVSAADIEGFVTPIGLVNGALPPTVAAAVTWDGTYLTIPVANRFVFAGTNDDGSFDGSLFDVTTFGQIVAVVVPEPSSIAILACGAIGLVGYAVRRKRKG
jgi:hypothetical protein